MSVVKRLVVGVLGLVLLSPAVFATGQKEPAPAVEQPTPQPAGAQWKIGDNVSLDWYLNFSWWPYTNKWTEYPVLKSVSDTTGVVPNIILPTGNETEKLNLMIASGDLPDIITVALTDPIVKKLISQGLVSSFDELIANYAPDFKNEIPKDVWNYTRSDVDKKLYGVPSFFKPDWQWKEAYDIGFYAYNVYAEYYKAIGSPDMSTPESYAAALKKFKAAYPKIADRTSIPLSLAPSAAYLPAFENSFGIKYFGEDAAHNLTIRYKDPRYVELARFINGLFRDGLLDPETYVKKSEQYNEDIANARVFSAPAGWYYLPVAPAIAEKPDSYFMAVEPMKTKDFKGFVIESRLGWTITMVSKKAKNPAAAIRFIRYMWSKEGNTLMNYGVAGQNYTLDNNTIVRTPATAADMKTNAFEFQKKTGIYAFNILFYPYWRVRQDDTPAVAADRTIADKYAIDCTQYNYNMKPDPTSPEGIISMQVDDLVAKEFPKIVMAESAQAAVDALNAMNQKLDKIGLPQLEKYWTAQYLKNRDIFDIKD